jgi:hypothetical protein
LFCVTQGAACVLLQIWRKRGTTPHILECVADAERRPQTHEPEILPSW